LVSLQLDSPFVEPPITDNSSGGTLSIILLGLLAMIGIRRKK
jgi:hypothetical protein